MLVSTRRGGFAHERIRKRKIWIIRFGEVVICGFDDLSLLGRNKCSGFLRSVFEDHQLLLLAGRFDDSY